MAVTGKIDRKYVVPHAGTWIEIVWIPGIRSRNLSFPTRERGLKCKSYRGGWCYLVSFPTRERGLKCSTSVHCWGIRCRSPRGNVDWNKSFTELITGKKSSFPTRERGLKCRLKKKGLQTDLCRSPRGNVDWNNPHLINQMIHLLSFPTRERGLKFWSVAILLWNTKSFPTRERGLKFLNF